MTQDLLDLIDADPSVLHGQARFRGTRVSVSVVLDCLATGMTEAEIAEYYPSLPPLLRRDDVVQRSDPHHDAAHVLEFGAVD